MRNQLENIVAGEAITASALVYFDGVDGKAYLASAATTDNPAQAIVMVDCTEGGDGQAYFSGEVDYSFGSVSKGTPLYLSATAGEITDTAPTNAQRVGFVLSDNTAMFNFQAFAGGVDGGGGASYLVYTATLVQSGTSAPTATVLENTLGGTVAWTYDSDGTYEGALTGAFTSGKVFLHLENLFWDGANTNLLQWVDADTIRLIIAAGDDFLGGGNEAQIEIRVYP